MTWSPQIRPRAAIVAAAAALTVAGCSPIQTSEQYHPADGVSASVGSIQIRDLLIVSDGKSAPGTVSGNVSNDSGQAQKVTFALSQEATASREVPAHSAAPISLADQQVSLASIETEPGTTVALSINTPDGGTAVVTGVPVLKPDGYYASLRPADAPAPTPR